MDQEGYWETKWENRKNEPVNNFARRSYSLIKNKGLKILLDLGCGDGRDSIYFAKGGMKVTAVDFSRGGINILKRQINQKKIKNIAPVCCDVRKMKFKENSFDVIYAHLSLHYFNDKDTTKIFNKLHKILKKNGLLFIKCKSTEDALYGKGKKIGENMYIKGHLRHFFNKNYMKEKLRKFKILKMIKTSSVYHEYRSSFVEAIATKQ